MSATLPYQLQQPSLRVVVMLMLPHVARELVDAFGEDSDLNFSGACVALVRGVLPDDFCLAFLRQHLVLRPTLLMVFSFGYLAV